MRVPDGGEGLSRYYILCAGRSALALQCRDRLALRRACGGALLGGEEHRVILVAP